MEAQLMKRDVDLIRQLLLEIERQGPDCSVDVLRNGAPPEADERTRYHVRLLVDAGLVKEIDRAAGGFACVRLTNAGHEFLDLCRSGARWREAKWVVQEQTGGLSLSVLRAVLTKWAVEGISRSERHRRWRRAYRPYYRSEPVYRGEPVYRVDSYRYEREPIFEDEPVRFVRPRPEFGERFDPVERWDDEPFSTDGELAERSLGVSLPVHMI
jgi:hypothetical protein